MPIKVFVTRPLASHTLAVLTGRCEVTCYQHDAPIPAAELQAALAEAEGAIVAGARLPAEVIGAAPRLRAVSNVGIGYDNLDLAALTARRIPATNTAGVVEEATADLTFSLILAVARRVVEGDRYLREGRWDRWQWHLLWGAEVNRKTLGIYGFGHIGQAVARRARGFNMRTLYHSRHRAPENVERELGAQLVDRQRLLAESDFLSLHVPMTPETRHLIGDGELALMKPSAFLINTARGPVVDEEALCKSLQHKQISGAALDVFEREPSVPKALIELPNVVLLPHIGSATEETRSAMARFAAQNLLDLFDGKRPANLLNPEVFN